MGFIFKKLILAVRAIKQIGFKPQMDDYEKRRLGIFNLINFSGAMTGIFTPLAALNSSGYLPPIAWVVACAPFVISSVVLAANYLRQYQFALIWYFFLYPIVTSLVYLGGIDVGIELLFVLYGVLAVFLFQNIRASLIPISFTIICYLAIFTIHGKYDYIMKEINPIFYFFNQFFSLFFIFLGLFLIKQENTAFQRQLSTSNNKLIDANLELNTKQNEIVTKANLLEEQAEKLSNLNSLKDRMFSIISHDLKNPIYSLRNLFRNVQQYDLPAEEIKILIPDILNELNYTTSLMENLLSWAKGQMQGYSINQQPVHAKSLITETIKQLQLQAQAKEIMIKDSVNEKLILFADRDMLSLVLRNLISNAIKFTPKSGIIYLEATAKQELVEVFVKDTGVGISTENINKLFEDKNFSTKGTSNESGTGLGLMLCKDFITKNGGEIFVESKVGIGSKFIFTVPKG